MSDPGSRVRPLEGGEAVLDRRSVEETGRLVEARTGGLPVRCEQMALVAGIYRAAAAVRQHFENSVLRSADLTWTGFVVLWVVWLREEPETRHVAEEAGISKGTLTGVVRTLESRGLVRRTGHPGDGRLVLLSLTERGAALMRRLFPEFNAEEVFVTGQLDEEECRYAAELLHRVVAQVALHGEERRRLLLGGERPAPRRSGRRRANGGEGADAPGDAGAEGGAEGPHGA
ncbi:MarR family winged helix-turn-helix transcriptional regulator [Streptomyces rhizoryzae]|uniref:MarR family winged helix-turn-helix transcriptional regulator n=1 Tax=Streptomyces rhizoryzae TaxID=2932493 RepID=UPI00249DE772